jgi:hypothetical protein
MKNSARLVLSGAFIAVVTASAIRSQASTLTTLQNSPLSVTAEAFASTGLSSPTNLVNSNVMVSTVNPLTAQGRRASLGDLQQWVTLYNDGPTSSENAGNAIAVRSDGSIVVTGPSVGVGTGYDFVTICYASNGTALWTNRYDGPDHGDDFGGLVATAPGGDVWVTGESARYATNDSLTDIATIMYASNGAPVWTNRYTGFETNGAYETGFLVDAANNAYLEQSSTYWPPSGSGIPVENSITKYDPLGNVVWTRHYLATAPDSGQDIHETGPIVADASGNFFVAGMTGSENYETGVSIVKYAGDGTELWTNHFAFQVMFLTRQLLLDPNGDLILTGESSTNYAPLYVVAKSTKEGISLWTNLSANFGSNAMITGAVADSAGNLFVLGNAPDSGGGSDFVTVKYLSDGQPIWTNRFTNAPGLDNYPSAMAVDGSGSVYVTGESAQPTGAMDLTIVKYADTLFYVPLGNYIGPDTINYTVTDTSGNSADGTLSVIVAPGAFQFDLSSATTTLTAGELQFQVSGAPGINPVVVEASADLIQWQPISTNTPFNGSVQFVDPAVTNPAPRFYRALQQQ